MTYEEIEARLELLGLVTARQSLHQHAVRLGRDIFEKSPRRDMGVSAQRAARELIAVAVTKEMVTPRELDPHTLLNDWVAALAWAIARLLCADDAAVVAAQVALNELTPEQRALVIAAFMSKQ